MESARTNEDVAPLLLPVLMLVVVVVSTTARRRRASMMMVTNDQARNKGVAFEEALLIGQQTDDRPRPMLVVQTSFLFTAVLREVDEQRVV